MISSEGIYNMKKILIPIDGSEFSQRALAAGKAIAEAFQSDLILMHVVNMDTLGMIGDTGYYMEKGTTYFDVHEDLKQKAEALVSHAKESLGENAPRATTVVAEGYPPSVIIDYVKNNNIDLVVIGSRGMASAAHKLLLGSVASKVVHGVDVPVMIVK